MANAILDKFGSPTALTITLASLASSTSGVGRQSTLVDNSTNRYQAVMLYVKIKQGTSPTSSKGVYIYLLRDDGAAGVTTDGAGASDAAITVLNAQLIGFLANKSSAATGDVVQDAFLIERPGPKWGVAIVHDTVAALDATGGNHTVEFVGMNPEVQ